MAAIDDITNLAQDVYLTINGSLNDDTDDDLETFQNEFIRQFNLWLDEYETEAYWNKLRVNDYQLATVSDVTTYVFPLGDDYRTPVFNQDKYLKVISSDGNTRLSRYKLVDPNQRENDDLYNAYWADRATFVNGNIVLSRPPRDTDLGSSLVLDVVMYHPRLARNDSTGIDYLPSKQLAVLGIAKNMTLSNVTKVALSPSFAQKYNDELKKQLAINNASNEAYEAEFSNFGYITGSW